MDWESFSDKVGSFGERVGRGLKGLFGSENERFLRTLSPMLTEIAGLEPWAQGLDGDQIRGEVQAYMRAVQDDGVELDEFLPRMFALTREAAVRTLGMRHYDVQIVGGYVLHQGKIAEMMTGEGKTLVATLPLALNALSGRPCCLVTVNDYLAKRDGNWMRPVYEYLGLTIESIQADMDAMTRKPIYDANIIYGTNNEFGFDYLRDNMKTSVEQQVQRDLYFAIVDEVDSILIDEARTPLIISGPAEDHIGKYLEADKIAVQLVKDEHYEVKEKERSASMTEAGIMKAQELLGIESFYEPGHEDWPHYLENAIRAYELYNNDKEYVVEAVQDQRTGQTTTEVVIVDEFTGRKMAGRRWSDGLHQAVEVKEKLNPKQETQTLATITFQNYFRMYDKLAGMTGTALTEAGEFHKIYDLDVVSIPTNVAITRADHTDKVYRTEPEKWEAICDELEDLHEAGQPVLVGTASVEMSQKVSSLLTERKVKHEVLNAKNHEREASIIAMAGARGAVTVATNMAGRGTDIKLGGNFEYLLDEALQSKGLVVGDEDQLEEIDQVRSELREECDRLEAEVMDLGGLYVLGTERHEARRIDNQLRGRSGRQGNAGTSRFFLSLEDPLMRIFYSDRVKSMMKSLGMKEGQEIESKMVSNAIARAQKKVEDRNFEIRKSLLEYDEVMDQQRKNIYGVRQEVLESIGLKDKALHMIENCLDRSVAVHIEDPDGLKEWCLKTYGLEIATSDAELAADPEHPNFQPILEALRARYDEREATFGDELTRRIESYLILNAIDSKWKDHLKAVDALKAGIGLRGYGQEDPKTAYKKEGTKLFQEHLLPAIEDEVASLVLRIQVGRPQPAEGEEAPEGDEGEATPDAASALQPKGMVSGGGNPNQGGMITGPDGRQYTQEQVAQIRARQQQMMRQAMRPAAPASAAFDVMRRRQAVAAQQQAAQQQAGQAESGGGGGAASAASAPPKAAPARPAPPAKEPIAGLSPEEMEAIGRNDPCPCGSGKKYKKCHG